MPDYFPEDVYEREIPTEPLDIYMTSPPCQAFSLSGKRGGEADKRGILFYNSHEFILKNNPRYFIFENVKGLLSDDSGKTFQKWLDHLGGKSVNGNPVIFPLENAAPYHIYHKVLNAKNYGVPQNRERVFIIGIRDDEDNHFSFPREIPLTKRLKDVLEDEVDEKYFLSDKMIEGFISHSERHKEKGTGFGFKPKKGSDMANCLRANAALAPTDNMIIEGDLNKGGQRGVVYSENSKIMSCLTTTDYKQPKQIKVKSATKKGYEIATEEDSINFSVPSSETRRGRVGKGVAQTLDTACNQGVIQLNPSKESGGKQPYQQNRIYSTEGVMTTLDTDSGRRSILENYRIRRLTVRECFRLMDFPDTFSWNVSDSQAYKQAGNSICVAVLAALIEKLNLNPGELKNLGLAG